MRNVSLHCAVSPSVTGREPRLVYAGLTGAAGSRPAAPLVAIVSSVPEAVFWPLSAFSRVPECRPPCCQPGTAPLRRRPSRGLHFVDAASIAARLSWDAERAMTHICRTGARGHDDEDTSRCSTGACFVVGIGEISQHLLVEVTGDGSEERRVVREPYLLGIIVLILFESEKH